MCWELFAGCKHLQLIFPGFSLDVLMKSGEFNHRLVSEQNLQQESTTVQLRDLTPHSLQGDIGGLEFAGLSLSLTSGEIQCLECTLAVSDIESIRGLR
jgi:hypothetical protein